MDKFLCPITNEPIIKGGMTSVGQLYEFDAIKHWLQNHNTDPMTNIIMIDKTITEIDVVSKNIDEINKIILDIRNGRVISDVKNKYQNVFSDNNNEVRVYATNFNILRIVSGTAGLIYSN
jgi:hypothetical protein